MVDIGLINSEKTKYEDKRVEIVGKMLFDELCVSQSFRDTLIQHSDIKDDDPLHIQIAYGATSIQNSCLSLCPWHLMYDDKKIICKGDPNFLIKKKVRFSYLIKFDQNPPSLDVSELQKINLLLISSPISNSENENFVSKDSKEIIKDGIKKKPGRIEFVGETEPILSELHRTISELDDGKAPHIIHFDGHGEFGRRCHQCRDKIFSSTVEKCENKNCDCSLEATQGYLKWKNNEDKTDYVSSEEFVELINSIDPKPKLVVLAACKSAYANRGESVFNGFAQRLIAEEVCAVVGFSFSIKDKSAQHFIEHFYRKLIVQNKSLLDSVHLGTYLIPEKDKKYEWYKPVLFMRYGEGVEDGNIVRFPSENPVLENNKPISYENVSPPKSIDKVYVKEENKHEVNNPNPHQPTSIKTITKFLEKSLILSEVAALTYDLFKEKGVEQVFIDIYSNLLDKLDTHFAKIDFKKMSDESKRSIFTAEEQSTEYSKLCLEIEKQIREEQETINQFNSSGDLHDRGSFRSKFGPLITNTGMIEGRLRELYDNSS